MIVKIELKGWLGGDNKKVITMDLPNGATVMDAINIIGVPFEELGFAMLDGKVINREIHKLVDGDYVEIYPVIFGG